MKGVIGATLSFSLSPFLRVLLASFLSAILVSLAIYRKREREREREQWIKMYRIEGRQTICPFQRIFSISDKGRI